MVPKIELKTTGKEVPFKGSTEYQDNFKSANNAKNIALNVRKQNVENDDMIFIRLIHCSV